jgi:hypothetical protein
VRAAAALVLAAATLAQEKTPSRPEPSLPQAAAEQPVAFSHRLHAEKAGLPCDFCHAGAAKGDAAGLPPTETCLTCHRAIKTDSPEVAKIKAAADARERIAWVPVYRVPDFVFFGHAPHMKAGLACAECHGPVATRDVLQKEISTSMTVCVDCHKAKGARQDCAACHTLGH